MVEFERPIKLDVKIIPGEIWDRITIKGHPIGGIVAAGPKEIIAEIAFRLNAFEIADAEGDLIVPEGCDFRDYIEKGPGTPEHAEGGPA